MAKKRKNVIRQGDVILVRVDSVPEGAQELDTKIVQPSEVHGKAHKFQDDAPVTIFQTQTEPSKETTITDDYGKFILVGDDTFIYHGKGQEPMVPSVETCTDHHALLVPAGTYKVVIKREWDNSRNVEVPVKD